MEPTGSNMEAKGSKMEPKGSRRAQKVAKKEPKGSRKGPKANQNRRQKRCRKKKVLKTLLEPSWGDLRAFWRTSWGSKKHFRIGKTNTGAKFAFFMKISDQDAF